MNNTLDTTSRKRFIKSIINTPLVVAEVGVAHGDFSKHMLTCRSDLKLYCIDIWENNILLAEGHAGYLKTVENLSSIDKTRYELVKGVSPVISSKFEDAFFDVVFVDADHEYEPVLADIRAWYPKVKSGGILFGHDYDMPWTGVITAVDQFCRENDYTLGIISPNGNSLDGDQDGGVRSWYIVKR